MTTSRAMADLSIRGIVAPTGDQTGSQVLMAPLARWDWSGQRDFRRIIERIDAETGVAPQLTEKPRDATQARNETNKPAESGKGPTGIDEP